MTLISKVIVAALVISAVVFPGLAVDVLGRINAAMLASFNAYYIYAVGLMLLFCLLVGLGPWGSRRRGIASSGACCSLWWSVLCSWRVVCRRFRKPC
ncbi:BCCT family transporter [Halomonas sp. THAF12]|uniref:BCCT family transporter n=1 Tax=Halomonas sp. B23F22_10 TaxID=3459515 RepID=UPI00373E83C0